MPLDCPLCPVIVTESSWTLYPGNLTCVGSEEGALFPPTIKSRVGRCVERIKVFAQDTNTIIDDHQQTDYSILFDERSSDEDFEAVEASTKADINGYCSGLFELIGAVDRAQKRHSWLEALGQQSKSECIANNNAVNSSSVGEFLSPPKEHADSSAATAGQADHRKSVPEFVEAMLAPGSR